MDPNNKVIIDWLATKLGEAGIDMVFHSFRGGDLLELRFRMDDSTIQIGAKNSELHFGGQITYRSEQNG